MLLDLNVKNLGLIDSAEITFKEGLNILTGETGAGKSMLLGSLNLAFGGKLEPSIIKDKEKPLYVEAVFSISKEHQREKLREMGFFVEEDEMILSRKYQNGRWSNRINGETVTIKALQQVSEILIDIYGQHEQQLLLNQNKHLDILDEYAGEQVWKIKKELAQCFQNYQKIKKEYEDASENKEKRIREISFMEFEVKEIEKANLRVGEDEELESQFHLMNNSRRIVEVLGQIHHITGYGNRESAGELLGNCVKLMESLPQDVERLQEQKGQLVEIDGLLNDFNRDIAQYLEELEFSEEQFHYTEERLNLINTLKSKYGKTIAEILAYREEKCKQLEACIDYDAYLEHLSRNYAEARKELEKISEELSKLRRIFGKKLCEEVKVHLSDLNFLNTELTFDFQRLADFTKNGTDAAQFMIATNVGEPLRPLQSTASGGELSRIMLAIKTVMADHDEIDTLIFDEIDTGISGRTAQKVSEKMAVISKNHQLLCITHLPQIAAMADNHFIIEKTVKRDKTITSVRELSKEAQIEEIARMLGGVSITETTLQNAREMKELAKNV